MIPEVITYEYARNCWLKYKVSEDTLESFSRYVYHKIPMGDFLTAVLSNDLKESFYRADYINQNNMFGIVSFCYNELPAICWGSHERIEGWLS
jgi:hypothetical protein